MAKRKKFTVGDLVEYFGDIGEISSFTEDGRAVILRLKTQSLEHVHYENLQAVSINSLSAYVRYFAKINRSSEREHEKLQEKHDSMLKKLGQFFLENFDPKETH